MYERMTAPTASATELGCRALCTPLRVRPLSAVAAARAPVRSHERVPPDRCVAIGLQRVLENGRHATFACARAPGRRGRLSDWRA
jgi:hypothetical protein